MPDIERVKAAQAERLRYLYATYDREDQGEDFPNVGDVMLDIGRPDATWEEAQRVVEPLAGDGMLDPVDTASGIAAARLSPTGRRLVEDRVTDAGQVQAPASIGDVKIEGSGNVLNVQQHSPGAQQNTAVHYESYHFRKIGQWLEDVERRAPYHGMPEQDAAEVAERVEELRGELAKPEPDHTLIQRVGRHIVRVLAATEASMASTGMVEAGRAVFG